MKVACYYCSGTLFSVMHPLISGLMSQPMFLILFSCALITFMLGMCVGQQCLNSKLKVIDYSL